ncbi:MAG TPA: amidohydrolase family protein [Pirellulales bacterium]|nr:amidohydrolase family protein [Pirellulales bacterium]
MLPRATPRIWDLHCHITSPAGRTPIERMADLMRYADRMRIERVCIYMGYPHSMQPSPERLREENDQVLEALSHWHDRAFGFCYVSGEHVEASLKEIDRCVRDGPMVGIKLWVAKRCNDPSLDPIIRRAAELKAVIFQHTWLKTDGNNGPGESTPDDLVELAKRHPGVPLICGHTGGTWELGIRTVRPMKQISIDLAGSDPTNGFTEMAVRELGADRVIYGSDAPGRSFASQLAKVVGADLDDATKEQILGGNLRRMMAPILAAKGVRV